MKALRIALLMLPLTAFVVKAQPVERPPRPGETTETQPGRVTPILDRDYRNLNEIEPSFGGSISKILSPEGTRASLFGGIRYGRLGFGIELGYTDYEREFHGSKVSWMSPSDSIVIEKGSFVNPAVYTCYSFEIGRFSIAPRFKIGMADIVTRRWYPVDEEAQNRFERKRLVNTWEMGFNVPIGSVKLSAFAEWTAVNPWFFILPEDFGILSAGLAIQY